MDFLAWEAVCLHPHALLAKIGPISLSELSSASRRAVHGNGELTDCPVQDRTHGISSALTVGKKEKRRRKHTNNNKKRNKSPNSNNKTKKLQQQQKTDFGMKRYLSHWRKTSSIFIFIIIFIIERRTVGDFSGTILQRWDNCCWLLLLSVTMGVHSTFSPLQWLLLGKRLLSLYASSLWILLSF